jgi:transglutaminase-like putative cysteine protease
VDLERAARAQPAAPPEDVQVFLQPTRHIATDGIVLDIALRAAQGATTPLEKARGIYEWIVDNTFREPTTRGCGVGDIKFMLETGNLGGKCADINSLLVGMARAVGIPARELFGIRVADSALFKSLGKSGDISKAQHCRAEFYLAGFGWIPADPADVRKVVLEEKLPLTDPRVVEPRKRLFGNWEMNCIAYNDARDFSLEPGMDIDPVNFFRYPIRAAGASRRDSLDSPKFAYRILAEEVTA